MKCCLSPVLVFLCVCHVAAQAPAPKEPAKCSVQGQVVQEPGSRPLRKASLELTPVDQEDGTSYTASSDAEGHFKIEDIKPGRYDLSAEHSGFSGIGRHRGSKTLALNPGQDLKDIVFQLQPAAVVAGKIVDLDGDPVPRVLVVAERYAHARYRFWRSGQTNDLGEYRISDLRPGRYLIKATLMRQTFEPQTAAVGGARPTISYSTYYPATVDKTQAVPLDLRAGEEMPINFALLYGPAFRIRGTVAHVPELDSPGFSVSLRSKDPEWPLPSSESEVKKDGSFEIRDVPPGSYSVLLTNYTGDAPQIMPTSQMIGMKESDLENLRIAPVPVGQVHGQLRMENAQRVDWGDATVMLDSGDEYSGYGIPSVADARNAAAQIKKDGTFEMKTVQAGNYHILVFSGPTFMRDCFVKSINAGGKDIADSGFNMSGGTWSLDIVVSSNGARVDGVVVDDKQQPVADAEVVLIPEASRQKRRDLYQNGTTDQHGRFILRGLNPGEYTLMALADLEDDYRDPEFLKTHEGMGQRVKLDEGQHLNISLKLAATGSGQP